MPRISIMTQDKARAAAPLLVSGGSSLSYFDGEKHPLHLHLTQLSSGETVQFGIDSTDRILFIWHGEVEAGGIKLPAGSSIIIEKGRGLAIKGGAEGASVLVFAAAVPSTAKAGGHIHLLPAGRVPKAAANAGGSGVSGGMHADSTCATCEVWLHENHFPGGTAIAPEEQAQGVHSHTEDEIIFVTAGQIRLGNRLSGAGTALAIAAGTLYSFTAGPEGMSFVNFRASMPGDILFANGMAISETGYWQERVQPPQYLSVD